MTTRDVVEQYFHRRFVPPTKGDRASTALSAIQRSIQSAWPDEIAISRMKNRAADVTRKVMILLFIATDGGFSDEDDELLDEWEETSVFEDAYARLNDMLGLEPFLATPVRQLSLGQRMRGDLVSAIDRGDLLGTRTHVSDRHILAQKRPRSPKQSRIEIEGRTQSVAVKQLDQPLILRHTVVVAKGYGFQLLHCLFLRFSLIDQWRCALEGRNAKYFFS
jgi:hypothetical protein